MHNIKECFTIEASVTDFTTRTFTACDNNRKDSKQQTKAKCISKPSMLHVSAAQCVRRIKARGLIVFLFFLQRGSRRETENFFLNAFPMLRVGKIFRQKSPSSYERSDKNFLLKEKFFVADE